MRHLRSSILSFTLLALTACTALKTTTNNNEHVIPTLDSSAVRVSQVRTWLQQQSLLAKSLMASGSLSVEQNGSSNSANFVLRSKRLNESVTERIDSFSLEVTGPFGITVARFIASPQEYQMNDILHGDTRRGPTDPHSLEALTHLNGITLSMMNDLIYGLAPGGDSYMPLDSLTFYTSGVEHALVVYRKEQNATELITLGGQFPGMDGTTSDYPLFVSGYERWNGTIPDPVQTAAKPAVNIHYSERTTINGFSIPQRIEAQAGNNSLTLEYSDTHVNPSGLTVHIKMPK